MGEQKMEIHCNDIDIIEFEKQMNTSFEECLDEEVYCSFEYGS